VNARPHRLTSCHILFEGYPSSTAPGYAQFAAGQMTSIVLSTAAGVLSMQVW